MVTEMEPSPNPEPPNSAEFHQATPPIGAKNKRQRESLPYPEPQASACANSQEQSEPQASACANPQEQSNRRALPSEDVLGKNSSRRIENIWRALESVTDPEIPVINVVEMGIIANVRINDAGVTVDMTPTFVGCPALDVIRQDIRRTVFDLGEPDVTVNVVFDPPWTTDRIQPSGLEKLKAFGLAPPVGSCSARLAESSMPDLEKIPCPFCDSANTELESMFGPTLCRSIHYCRNCLQSFEHFKTV